MITYPNAKINLGLQVVERRPDGYHNLETVFYPIPLFDELEVSLSTADTPYILYTDGIPVEGNAEDNLVIKALELLRHEGFSIPPVEVHLTKHIPSGAGLGGGSADAAFMLKLLNEQFQLGIGVEKLQVYAARLGADCAIFIQNVPVYAEGIGNVFTSVSLSLTGYWLAVVKPPVFVSTRAAFAQLTPHAGAFDLREVILRPVNEWRDCMVNDFEPSVFAQFPEVGRIKEQLYQAGAVYAAMSGSGSSLFALFNSQPTALKACFPDCFVECLKF